MSWAIDTSHSPNTYRVSALYQAGLDSKFQGKLVCGSLLLEL